MKYIEELNSGDCFNYDNKSYLITSDFKKDNSKLCINLESGFPKWFLPEIIVKKIEIYTLDESNNIVPIKETKKDEIQK